MRLGRFLGKGKKGHLLIGPDGEHTWKATSDTYPAPRGSADPKSEAKTAPTFTGFISSVGSHYLHLFCETEIMNQVKLREACLLFIVYYLLLPAS